VIITFLSHIPEDSGLIKWPNRFFCYGIQQTDKTSTSTQAVSKTHIQVFYDMGSLIDASLGFRNGNSLETPRSRIPVADHDVSKIMNHTEIMAFLTVST
jgi:hypothetical protein